MPTPAAGLEARPTRERLHHENHIFRRVVGSDGLLRRRCVCELVFAREPPQGESQTSLVDAGTGIISEESRAKIEEALPTQAIAPPKKPRKLLIYDVNVGYPGHPSRFFANLAIKRMGEKTGAFQTVISRDPSVFERKSLQQFDAVFLNNTVGNLFIDPQLRQSLLEFVVRRWGTARCPWNVCGVHALARCSRRLARICSDARRTRSQTSGQ